MILRFMGDMHEPTPKEEFNDPQPTSLRKKVSTLGRKFLSNSNRLVEQVEQNEDEDDELAQVSIQTCIALYLLY